MYYVTTAGTGSLTPVGQLAWKYAGRSSTAAMFRPGKILQVSGNSNGAVVIDINGALPVVTPTASLSSQRAWANSTILPDGRVLVTGGSQVANQLVNVNNRAEIWDPDTGTWTVGPNGDRRARLYHSMALLLPDASVLVGGGGAATDAPVENLHSEIYYPPYLYNASGEFASRPVINSAPDTLTAGQSFSVGVGTQDIQRVTLVKTSAVTHSFNMDQRFVDLSFIASGDTLSVQMPQRATDVTPGYYLLFVINANGTPSKGKIVRVPIADTAAPTQPQKLTLSKVNGHPKLAWTASTDAVGVTGYAIHRSTDGTLGAEIAREPSTTWSDMSAQEGTQYTYGVKAYDAAGNLSAASALKSMNVCQQPTNPGKFSVTLANGDPRLNWNPSTDNVGVVGYNIYRSTNGTVGPLFAQTAAAPWVDTSATVGVTYTYTVRARDAAGCLSGTPSAKTVTAQ